MAAPDPQIVVGGADPDLEAELSRELDVYNLSRTGTDAPRELTLKAHDVDGRLVAGLSGWTWGTCAAISMVWVREDQRGEGWGTRLMATAEEEARNRGCERAAVSSFTFQAPGRDWPYRRHPSRGVRRRAPDQAPLGQGGVRGPLLPRGSGAYGPTAQVGGGPVETACRWSTG